MINRNMVGLVVALVGLEPLLAQQPRDDRKVDDPRVNVKAWTEIKTANGSCSGEVVRVSEESLTVRMEFENSDGDVRIVFRDVFPSDLLAGGKIMKGVSGSCAYLWSDIKENDYINLRTIRDDGDGRHYCFDVCIMRRPGAKLPESQNPKKDGRYVRDSLLNDINNGEDVSDEAIAKIYPARPYDPRTRAPADPGGLPQKWQEKLDAIREKAKKDKELKAKPVEKKDDKK